MAKCEIYRSCENSANRICKECGKSVCKLHSSVENKKVICDRCLITEILENRNSFRLEEE